MITKVRPVQIHEQVLTKKASLRQDSIRSAHFSLLSEGSVVETSTSFKPRDIKYSEIMSYYNPKWLAAVGFVASMFASLSLPLFGLVLSYYVFMLSKLAGEPTNLAI